MWALVCALSLAAAPGAGQAVGGRLLDVVSEKPIPGGVLHLRLDGGAPVTTTVSDVDGYWWIDAPAAGVYRIAAEAFGYRDEESQPFELANGDELETTFHLQPTAILLDPIEVEVRRTRAYLERTGFFDRQRGNFGHFITPEAISDRRATRVTDLLSIVPGVRIGHSGEGSAGPAEVVMRGSNITQGGGCRPRIFVDGLMYNRGDGRFVTDDEMTATEERVEEMYREDQALKLDDIGHPSTIAGIEVYRSASQVPAQFGGTSVESLCGAIVVWTRTGTPTGGRS